jgi:hypothetical protein
VSRIEIRPFDNCVVDKSAHQTKRRSTPPFKFELSVFLTFQAAATEQFWSKAFFNSSAICLAQRPSMTALHHEDQLILCRAIDGDGGG